MSLGSMQMCGRYGLQEMPDAGWSQLKIKWPADWLPSWNIAPLDDGLVIRMAAERPTAEPMQWGLLPWWAEIEQRQYRAKRTAGMTAAPEVSRPRWVRDGSPWFNARSETIATNRAFREAFRERRCLIPASGFYEWTVSAGRKVPHWITVASAPVYAMAGIWEEREAPDGATLRTYSIATCPPNELVAQFHDRMPVILAPDDHGRWLAGDEPRALLKPYPARDMTARPVSTLVNSALNDGPELLDAPLAEQLKLF